MKLSDRSYPYPVVGNRDDVPGAAFQATVEMTTDKQSVYLDASINCSSKTLNDLIKRRDACFLLHVECSNTLFRRVFEFNDPSHRIRVPADNLNAAVEVNVFARATNDLHSYRVDAAHSDYGNVTFDVEKGDILAVGDGQVFYVESNFESFSRIGSIMQILQGRDADVPMTVDYSQDKIWIYLSKKDFADYKVLKGAEGVSAALTTAIVLPVLMQALIIAKDEEDDDLRWMRALRRRIEALELSFDRDPLELAQLILELPMRRTLSSARMQIEGASY